MGEESHKTMKYFKIQKGFGADDYLSIDETELQMAIRAQVTGKVAILKQGTISGNIIQAITPDYNRDMGWKRDYKLKGEDYDELGEEKIQSYRVFIERTNEEVNTQLGGTPKKEFTKEISNEIKQLTNSKRI